MEKTIDDFLNEEVKEHSIAVIKERALPCVIDGLKPSQRKILFTARKVAISYMKTSSLAGYVSPIGGYDKGDASLGPTITHLIQSFPGANNIPFLEGSGTFGSRFIPDGAAAPRYTKTKIHSNFKLHFMDGDLLEYDVVDNETFEPKYFLPILPTILLNPILGIATGWKCEFQPYEPYDIRKYIERILKGKKRTLATLVPHFKGFKGSVLCVVVDGKNEFFTRGIINRTEKKNLLITEIPLGISREKYLEHLNSMIDKGKIKDYTDKCNKEGFKFEIALSKDQNERYGDDFHLMVVDFKLSKRLLQHLNCITEDNKLKVFETPEEIIEYFVKFRLKLLTKRKKKIIQESKDRIEYLIQKIKFILYMSHGIDFSSIKNKKDLEERLLHFSHAAKLVELPLHSLNREEINKCKSEIKELEERIEYYKTVTETELYLKDLKQLK